MAPPPGSDNSTLSWRLSSLTSDWVLTLGHQAYNVHRCIVTEGPRHSLVFADLMQQQAHARMSHPTGGQPQATTLDNLMPAVVHSVFDNVLDFMYSGVLDPVRPHLHRSSHHSASKLTTSRHHRHSQHHHHHPFPPSP